MKTLSIRSLLLVVSVLMLTSCGARFVPKTFNYPAKNTSQPIHLSYDKVWSGVVDFFAENNIPISTIEKSSGLIISSPTQFPASYWITDEQRLYNPEAYIAVQELSDVKLDGTGMRATAGWNVRVRQVSEEYTEIQVNIATPLVQILLLNPNTFKNEWHNTICEARSTGVFEKHLAAYILSKYNK